MRSYRVTIDEPIEIIAAVYETKQRAANEGETIEVLLDHQEEPNVVRGYGEPLVYDEGEEGCHAADEGKIVKRPDGGLSWYHSSTGCYMRAEPGTADIEDIEEQRDQWMDRLTGLAAEVTGDEIEDDGMDVYTAEGNQLMGASSDHRDLSDGEIGYNGDADLQRSCWYEAGPKDERLDSLLQDDGIDPDAFYESIAIPKSSLLALLDDQLDPEYVRAEDFVSSESMEMAERLQENTDGRVQGSCVLSDY